MPVHQNALGFADKPIGFRLFLHRIKCAFQCRHFAVSAESDFDSRLKSLQDHAGYLSYRRQNLTGDGLSDYLDTAASRNDPLRRAHERRRCQFNAGGADYGSGYHTRWHRSGDAGAKDAIAL